MTTATLPLLNPQPLTQSTTASLRELLEDGIYLLFLLRNRNPPNTLTEFNQRVERFLAQFETSARALNKPPEAIRDAKYAFCALMDEIVLSSDFSIREDWERAPLQLRLFGEHLAGEHFFDKLETLRLDPSTHLDTLEVFYTCLLLGFQGRYLLEGPEKLNYLISRLGQEITHARGGKAEFSPHWKLPQRVQQYMRNELPLWLFFALLAIILATLFGSYRWILSEHTNDFSQTQAKPAILPAPESTPRTGA